MMIKIQDMNHYNISSTQVIHHKTANQASSPPSSDQLWSPSDEQKCIQRIKIERDMIKLIEIKF